MRKVPAEENLVLKLLIIPPQELLLISMLCLTKVKSIIFMKSMPVKKYGLLRLTKLARPAGQKIHPHTLLFKAKHTTLLRIIFYIHSVGLINQAPTSNQSF